ncbi:NAD(P)-binding protein [Irpex rosettiformis]|uniref:NAD(P)-binding protein n=1 Tax=Irpex rosettiformis TaxID=378272 RepID=A0ACB8UG09_9APHY|nr:NAD(P)-binding protein [Irpex rosettiformis]
MVQVADTELIAHAQRIHGKVLVITGAGSGIGREIALLYANYGAKVVIGDIDKDAADGVVYEITDSGGLAVAQRCDVTVWDELVALFDLAMDAYGSVDVVIPNAGIIGTPWLPLQTVGGKLSPPDLKTIDVNVVGVLHTCSLALHYLVPERETLTPDSVKALILIAAFHPMYGTVQYTASKHAILGIQRSLSPVCTMKGIRSGSVHPGFVDTPLIEGLADAGVTSGFPMIPVERVAAICLAIATDTDLDTSERPWLLVDGEGVERLHDFELSEGLYKELNSRLRGSMQPAKPFNVL